MITLDGKGGRLEIKTFTLDPASIAANSEGTETVTIPGLTSGDLVLVQPPSDLDAGLVFKGATVTDDDELSITLANVTASPVDGASKTWTLGVVITSDS